MRLVQIGFLIVTIVFPAISQSKELPEILRPDAAAVTEAESYGAGVFKLLPRGMFKDKEGSYKDEDNPLGLRQGGAYYSFTTGSHSYNKTPQIGLERGNLNVGFYGANYGLFVDCGAVPLIDESNHSDALIALMGYIPPKLRSELVKERERFSTGNTGMLTARHVPAVEGHTYLLRAISFNEADKLVAFRILKMDQDGSLTIAWRTLKDFEVPRLFERSEAELRNKVADVLRDPRFANVQFEVVGDEVSLRGTVARVDLPELIQAVANIRPGKIENRIRVK